MKKIFIASDHAGFVLKKYLIEKHSQFPWVDLGPNTEDRVDYPDFADKLCIEFSKQKDQENIMGVLICGSGQVMAMRANRYPYIRAAICWTPEIAKLAREHNDANVLCLGSRVITKEISIDILEAFINSKFENDRHTNRVKKLSKKI